MITVIDAKEILLCSQTILPDFDNLSAKWKWCASIIIMISIDFDFGIKECAIRREYQVLASFGVQDDYCYELVLDSQ